MYQIFSIDIMDGKNEESRKSPLSMAVSSQESFEGVETPEEVGLWCLWIGQIEAW